MTTLSSVAFADLRPILRCRRRLLAVLLLVAGVGILVAIAVPLYANI
jgi:hypothetical protein